MPEANSRVADRYRLSELLGRGGMGEVWQAYDERLNRECAIKVLRQMQDGATVERFSREARTLASLRHPGVVGVYDYGVDEDRPYLVMELLPGPSLAELLRDRGPLEFESVRRYGAQAAYALQAVHDAGVVHRDIKPANLVLDSTGACRLVDFGIALGATLDHTLTEHGAIIGSAAYLAPEQATGSRADARSDLYGFGCLLMTLLTGKPPFDDDAPVEILGRHLNDSPPRPSDRRPDVPSDLDQLVMDLLAKRPEARPPSADDVARRLGGGQPARPGPVPMPVRVAGAAAGAGHATANLPMPPAQRHAAPRGGRGTRALVVALALAAVVALGTVAWALARSDTDQVAGDIPAPAPTASAPVAPVPSTPPRATAAPPIDRPAPSAPVPVPIPTPSGPVIPPPDPTTDPPPETGAPVPAAELDALDAAIADAVFADPADMADLQEQADAIRAEAEDDRPEQADALAEEFIEAVGELEGDGDLDPEAAAALVQAAEDVQAALEP